MSIAFANPSYLVLLLLIPVIVYFGRRSLAGLDQTRRRLALFVRSLSIIFLVLILAEVQWQDEQDKLEVAFVLDRSRSVPEETRNASLVAFNNINKNMGRHDLSRLIVFGKDAATEQEINEAGQKIKRIQSLVGTDQTNIAKALDSAINSFSPGVKKRIVLFSDGNQTTGDFTALASRAREKGIVVDVVPLSYKLTKEIFVEKVVLPKNVKLNAPYLIRVVVRSLAKTNAVLELYEGGQRIASRRLALEPGVRVETFTRILTKAGFYNVRALLKPEKDSDELYQNNKAFAYVYAKGESKILYVQGEDLDEKPSPHFKTALANVGINFKTIIPAEMPRDENILQQYDAIILDDVAKYELTLKQQAAIARAVKNMGLGLVMIGGPKSFGAGSWQDPPEGAPGGDGDRFPVERALPVKMEPKQKTVIPTGALAIVMHSCEFPQGNDWGRKVTMKAIQTLSAKDYVGVVYYGMSGSEWRFPMQKAANKNALKRRIQGMEPGDMPDFDSSMRMAVNGLLKVKVSMRHMIILSDGDPSPPAPGLLKTCRDNKITITTICIQPHGGKQGSEVALMKRIATTTGGKFYYLTGPKALPKIFIKETKRVARPLIRNIEFTPRASLKSPIIKGFNKLPKLYGHVMTAPKATASVILNTPEKDTQPILIAWRYGVGKSVAFTSDVKPRWSGAWIQSPVYSAFWGQLVRWVSKDVEDSTFQVATKVEGDTGKIVVDAVDENGEFIDKLTVKGVVTTPDGKEQVVELEQAAPGRYKGEFKVGEVGNYTISLLSKDGKDSVAKAATSGLVFPYSDEFKKTQSNELILTEFAKLTKGRVVTLEEALKGDESFFNHDLNIEESLVPRWEFLMILLMCLFPIDVFIRRVMLDYSKIWSWMRAFRSSQPKAVESANQTLDRLRARKLALRGQELKKFEPTNEVFGDDASVAGGAASESNTNTGSPAKAEPPKPEEKPADFTSRLLQAKRRAQKDFEDNK
ncbi:MAG: VWA domain-containing protein [Planctomycetota bacterium]|nr:VWA domain-containing protein [Planctomycetota bacterium]